MARKPAPTSKKVAVPTTSYPLWLPNDQLEIIKEAQSASKKLWPEWVADAMQRFKCEPEEEIEVLLQTWLRDRKDKTRINIRITESTLEEIHELCAKNVNASKQACLQHALYIHALRMGY
jgi:predicted DNA binding CopG/RHH family protein